jgi:Transglycosylase SLT domain
MQMFLTSNPSAGAVRASKCISKVLPTHRAANPIVHSRSALFLALCLWLMHSPAQAVPRFMCTMVDGSERVLTQDLARSFRQSVRKCAQMADDDDDGPVAAVPPEAIRSRPTPLAKSEPLWRWGSTSIAKDEPAQRSKRERSTPSPVFTAKVTQIERETNVTPTTWRPGPSALLEGRNPAPPEPRSAPSSSDIDAAPSPALAAASPLPARAQALVHQTSRRYGLDSSLVIALVTVESAGKVQARSNKGALGLMQIMPGTGRRYGVERTRELLDPATNIETGVRYLRDLLLMFPGRVDLALAAYNAGEGAVVKYGNRIPPYPETQQYVRKIFARYQNLTGRSLRGTNGQARSLSLSELTSPANDSPSAPTVLSRRTDL